MIILDVLHGFLVRGGEIVERGDGHVINRDEDVIPIEFRAGITIALAAKNENALLPP